MSSLLLVEDEPRLAAAVVRGLEAEGFSVDHVADGLEALARAGAAGYDAIVLDLMLPGLDGREICRRLRAGGIETPILVLTARHGALSEAALLTAGADDYVTKPFALPVLLARIRALLRRAGPGSGDVVELGDLRIDPRSRRCWRADAVVELTPREFDLLHHLAGHPGRVVSKVEILDRVWDASFSGDPNIVEVYVRRLRNKVDRPFGRRTIETVRGSGYRMARGPEG
jgi:two-component system, OmpR family, response regulator